MSAAALSAEEGEGVSQNIENVEEEIARRHRAATTVVYAALAVTLALVVVALAGLFAGAVSYDQQVNIAIWIASIIFAFGAIALRRAMLAAPRLQAIAGLRGPTGLLVHLQKTTTLVAAIGVAIAVMGFVLALIRGGVDSMPVIVWVVAGVVLFSAYPRRDEWRRVVDAARKGGPVDESSAKGTLA